MSDSLAVVRAAGFAVAAALFWLQYFDAKDARRPEPRTLLLVAFALGAFSGLLALWTVLGLSFLGIPPVTDGRAADVAAYCLLVAGPVEEGAKFLVARAVCFRWKEFDERVDGLIYASAVALGFATVENLLYVPNMPWHQGLVRSLASPLTHSVFAAIWGFGAAKALIPRRSFVPRFLWQAVPLAVASALHGFYDYVIFAHDGMYAAAGIILMLWIGIILYARHAALLDESGAPKVRSRLPGTDRPQ